MKRYAIEHWQGTKWILCETHAKLSGAIARHAWLEYTLGNVIRVRGYRVKK